MDSVIPQSVEVVVDSEDEELLPLKVTGSVGHASNLADQASSIPTADLSLQQQASHTAPSQPEDPSLPPIAVQPFADDSISSISFKTPTVPRPRPKPRPVRKVPQLVEGAGSSSSIPTAHDTSVSSATPASSINASSSLSAEKPRPKPRPAPFSSIMDAFSPSKAGSSVDPIATASTGIQSHRMIIESPLDFSQDIAERAKMRSRARTSKTKPPVEDVIEISDEDELSFFSPAKPKRKTKPTKKPPNKRAKAARAEEIPDIESTPMSLPAPTSSLHLDSQLPPSDPPLPSTTTVPPTFTQADIDPIAGPPPSPLSSPMPDIIKKKKKIYKPVGSDDDGARIHRGNNLAPVSSGEIMPPPPPPFFASPANASASPADVFAAPGRYPASTSNGSAPPAAKKRKIKKRKAADDAEDIFIAEDGQSKARGRRKKDDDDDDYGAKPKPKPKRKAAPKTKKAEVEVEVLLDPPKPRSRSRTNSNEMLPEVVPETQPANIVVTLLDGNSAPPPVNNSKVLLHADRLAASTLSVPNAATNSKRNTTNHSGKPKGKETNSNTQMPEDRDTNSGIKSSNLLSSKSKGKRRAIESSDEEEDGDAPSKGNQATSSRKHVAPAGEASSQSSASGDLIHGESFNNNGDQASPVPPPPPIRTPLPPKSNAPSRANSFVPNGKSVPMSELIRKVNSQPGSPFTATRPTHSPYLKSSRSMLKRIAPLHPNRRTPPPPLPRPPPKKKTKKELEREEKWEQELEDSVQGWYCLPEEERAALRKAKRDAELGFDD